MMQTVRKQMHMHGLRLANSGLYHAALEVWENLLSDSSGLGDLFIDELYDEMGKVHVSLGDLPAALRCFHLAVDHARDRDSTVLYRMHLALTFRRMSEYDMAQRTFTQILDEFGPSLTPVQLGQLYANLAVLQSMNEFYSDALRSTQLSLKFFEQAGVQSHHSALYNNLGVFCLDLGRYEEAEQYLLRALSEKKTLSTVAELCRLYMQIGNLEESMAYASQALSWVWSSMMAYVREEIARLCRLLGQLGYYIGQRALALRLIEKSQLLFGQLGLWREWQHVQRLMDEWERGENHVLLPSTAPNLMQRIQLNRFVTLLDAMNAQELLDDRFVALLDTRVHYAQVLADHMDMGPDKRETITYACRFADYGLTAVEPEVYANPSRSPHAWAQYQIHPALSIEMLQIAQISDEVAAVIADHHERFDGTGYPQGKKGHQISLSASIVAVADYYASRVVLDRAQHSTVISELERERGARFHPDTVDAFCAMFREPQLT